MRGLNKTVALVPVRNEAPTQEHGGINPKLAAVHRALADSMEAIEARDFAGYCQASARLNEALCQHVPHLMGVAGAKRKRR